MTDIEPTGKNTEEVEVELEVSDKSNWDELVGKEV
jgi:hypothetical protein